MLVRADGRADHALAGHQLGELVGGGRAAAPVLAVSLAALVELGRIDPEQANFLVADHQGVAVLRLAGAENGRLGERRRGEELERAV